MGKKSVVVENFTCFTDDVERNVRTVGRLSLIERRRMLTANAKAVYTRYACVHGYYRYGIAACLGCDGERGWLSHGVSWGMATGTVTIVKKKTIFAGSGKSYSEVTFSLHNSYQMEPWTEQTDEKIKIVFIASCIESAAERVGCSPEEMLDRMEAVDLVDNYIYAHYDALHTESRPNLTDDIVETLEFWESEKTKNDGQD